jgi:predicted GIY-YIG superfamily endonuclease
VGAEIVREAAARAPHEPGVYCFVGADHDLLYVGKATDLRRRLADHARAKGAGVRSDVRVGLVHSVAWEQCASERDAALREADLIVALRPPYNASHTDQPSGPFVQLDVRTFALVARPANGGRAYGPFSHLAKGAHSQPAKSTKASYTALLRVLWVCQPAPAATLARIPRSIAGASPPPRVDIHVDETLRRSLHEYFDGRRRGFLPALRERSERAEAPDYMRTRLRADLDLADEFFDLAPARLRAFRRRHELPAGAVPSDVYAARLLDELRAVLGDSRLIVGQGGVGAPNARSMA